MFFVWGSKARISKVKPIEFLEGSCPNCQGDLQLSEIKKWFTLYWIPVFPTKTLETIYRCTGCKSTYRQNIRSAIAGSQMEQEQVQHQIKWMFATTLAACMTHMSKIDGEVSIEELEAVYDAARSFGDYEDDIDRVIEQVRESDDDEAVFEMLRKATQVLTKNGIMYMIAQSAKVLLADGVIHPKEEELLKKYMLITGIPENLYNDILNRVDEAQDSY